jgi:hypothetical protein
MSQQAEGAIKIISYLFYNVFHNLRSIKFVGHWMNTSRFKLVHRDLQSFPPYFTQADGQKLYSQNIPCGWEIKTNQDTFFLEHEQKENIYKICPYPAIFIEHSHVHHEMRSRLLHIACLTNKCILVPFRILNTMFSIPVNTFTIQSSLSAYSGM